MATPLVAGLAVLVRQFFADGYYPCGGGAASEAAAWSVVPASLVRAVLVLGASRCNEPTTTEGFGETDISAALADVEVLSVSAAFAHAGVTHSFLVCAVANATVRRVVVAWTDPPSPVTLNRITVSVLRQDTGALVASGSTTSLSTVLCLEVVADPGTMLLVQVRSAALVVAPQAYSLVVRGMGTQCTRNCTRGEAAAVPSTVSGSSVPQPQWVPMTADGASVSALLDAWVSDGTVQTFEWLFHGQNTSQTLYLEPLTYNQTVAACGGVDPTASGPRTGDFVRITHGTGLVHVDVSTIVEATRVWINQPVYLCANGSTWTAAETVPCTGAYELDTVPVRRCFVADLGTGLVVATAEVVTDEWDIACLGAWTGCGCTEKQRKVVEVQCMHVVAAAVAVLIIVLGEAWTRCRRGHWCYLVYAALLLVFSGCPWPWYTWIVHACAIAAAPAELAAPAATRILFGIVCAAAAVAQLAYADGSDSVGVLRLVVGIWFVLVGSRDRPGTYSKVETQEEVVKEETIADETHAQWAVVAEACVWALACVESVSFHPAVSIVAVASAALRRFRPAWWVYSLLLLYMLLQPGCSR
jgi:hypothetical protein